MSVYFQKGQPRAPKRKRGPPTSPPRRDWAPWRPPPAPPGDARAPARPRKRSAARRPAAAGPRRCRRPDGRALVAAFFLFSPRSGRVFGGRGLKAREKENPILDLDLEAPTWISVFLLVSQQKGTQPQQTTHSFSPGWIWVFLNLTSSCRLVSFCFPLKDPKIGDTSTALCLRVRGWCYKGQKEPPPPKKKNNKVFLFFYFETSTLCFIMSKGFIGFPPISRNHFPLLDRSLGEYFFLRGLRGATSRASPPRT